MISHLMNSSVEASFLILSMRKAFSVRENQLGRDVKTIDIASDSQTSLKLVESLKLQILSETF